MSEIAIVVPTLGRRPEWLREAVESINLQQSDVGPVRIWVVCPSDVELAVANALRGLHYRTLIRDAPGLSHAINEGFERALQDGASYLGWLGDDDTLLSGSLDATTSVLQTDLELAFVYGRVRYVNARGATLWLQRSSRFAVPWATIGKNFIPQQGSLFRASALREAGLLDETLKTAMDQDLFARLSRVGRWKYIRREIATFRIHESNLTVTKGAKDVESSQVAQKYRPAYAAPLSVIAPILDKVLYYVMRHLPTGG